MVGEIRRKATTNHLAKDQRKIVDWCDDLVHKRTYLDYLDGISPKLADYEWYQPGHLPPSGQTSIRYHGNPVGLCRGRGIVKLRAVWSSGDGMAYWAYHLGQEQ